MPAARPCPRARGPRGPRLPRRAGPSSFPLLVLGMDPREREQDHEGQRDRSHHDLRERYVRRLVEEEEKGEDEAVETHCHRLRERVPGAHHAEGADRDEEEGADLEEAHGQSSLTTSMGSEGGQVPFSRTKWARAVAWVTTAFMK